MIIIHPYYAAVALFDVMTQEQRDQGLPLRTILAFLTDFCNKYFVRYVCELKPNIGGCGEKWKGFYIDENDIIKLENADALEGYVEGSLWEDLSKAAAEYIEDYYGEKKNELGND